MTKKLILIALLIVAVGGGWFLFMRMNRERLYTSQERVLLVDRTAGVYTFSDIVDEATKRRFKPVNIVSRLSEKRLQELVAGLSLYGNVQPQVSLPGSTSVPENLAEWQEALVALTAEQQALCAAINSGFMSQECVMRHITLQILKGQAQSALCSALFIPNIREECAQYVAENDTDAYADTNANGLLDQYEVYVYPEAFPEPTL